MRHAPIVIGARSNVQEDAVLHTDPGRPLTVGRSRSTRRTGATARGLGADEVNGIVFERGEAEIGCDFGGLQYRFDAIDVGELFTPGRNQPPGSAALQ